MIPILVNVGQMLGWLDLVRMLRTQAAQNGASGSFTVILLLIIRDGCFGQSAPGLIHVPLKF